jgi:hypothetical protein
MSAEDMRNGGDGRPQRHHVLPERFAGDTVLTDTRGLAGASAAAGGRDGLTPAQDNEYYGGTPSPAVVVTMGLQHQQQQYEGYAPGTSSASALLSRLQQAQQHSQQTQQQQQQQQHQPLQLQQLEQQQRSGWNSIVWNSSSSSSSDG